MANLKVNNYDNLKLRINLDEYWDFYVNKDSYGSYRLPSGLYDNCLISYIDLCDSACTDDSEWVYSKSDYTWDESKAIDYTLYNITYTGVDNGLFKFRKDRISNKDFVKIFQENSFKIDESDYRLKLHAVSGNTLQYEYPIHFEECCTKFNGGFLQGFFKTECDKYQVLPTKFEDGDVYNFEFTLKKCSLDKESEKTLNDKYPDNKGIFFYIGTRAENKWIYEYDKNDEDGLETCYELGVDDFVEDGEIDKKSYIIGNFYDLDPEFKENPPIDIDNYLNFNYYNDELYTIDKCDWIDMSDYLEIEYRKKPKIIDENEKHSKIGWCCGEQNDKKKIDTILSPFFNGCGCQVNYKKKLIRTQEEEDDFLSGCINFGEGDYIDGWDGLKDPDTDYAEPELNISDFEYYSDNGFNLSEGNQYYFYTDNKFLFFDRTKTGKTVSNWVEGTQFMFSGRRSKFKGNLFILMNRTKTGYTVSNIDSLRDQYANEYNPYNDIYDNAFALRITDKGEIGYRLLTKDCSIEGRDKSLIMEGYSFENVIPNCEWVTVNVRMTFLGGDKMKLMFYVNGKLKYVTKELPRIKLKALNEIYDKQEGVPYNISIGGGTQGLAETIQRNYMLNPTRVYPLEQNFAGTFIGYISSFKIYNCMLEKMIIEHNWKYEKEHLL
jgi:hypothetical protein